MYTIWKVGDEEYRLCMTTLMSLQVEKQLGKGMSEIVDHISDMSVITTLLWGGLQKFNHGMTLKNVCELYDKYIASGGSFEQIMDVLMELLAQIGYGTQPDKNPQNSLTDVQSIEA